MPLSPVNTHYHAPDHPHPGNKFVVWASHRPPPPMTNIFCHFRPLFAHFGLVSATFPAKYAASPHPHLYGNPSWPCYPLLALLVRCWPCQPFWTCFSPFLLILTRLCALWPFGTLLATAATFPAYVGRSSDPVHHSCPVGPVPANPGPLSASSVFLFLHFAFSCPFLFVLPFAGHSSPFLPMWVFLRPTWWAQA